MANDLIKRLRYFTGQFLEEADFQAEQSYHIGHRRRANQILWLKAGILDNGFEVKSIRGKPTFILITKGVGVDQEGRELVRLNDWEVSLPQAEGQKVVVLSYDEEQTDQQFEDQDVSDNTRWQEVPQVSFADDLPKDRSQLIVLALVQINADGELASEPDLSVRQIAAARLPGDLTMPGDLTIGQDGNGTLHTRHIDGKDFSSDAQDHLFLNYATNKDVYLGFGNGSRSSLYVSGNLGIGAPSATSALEIRGPRSPVGPAGQREISLSFEASGSARIRAFQGGNWDTTLEFLTTSVNRGSDSPEVRLHIGENGNVGIGTGSSLPAARLHVSGGASAAIGVWGSGGTNGPGGVFSGGEGRAPAISLRPSGDAEAVRIESVSASPARYSNPRKMAMFLPGMDWNCDWSTSQPGSARPRGPFLNGASILCSNGESRYLWRVFRLPLNAVITGVSPIFNHSGTSSTARMLAELTIRRYSIRALPPAWTSTSVLASDSRYSIIYEAGANLAQSYLLALNQSAAARTVTSTSQWFGCDLFISVGTDGYNHFEGLVIGYDMFDTLYLL